eukprot:gnl/Spiro4/23774_TR11759_c0_g1_i1.p1 gnl/Spiro4/23774_TR11759_c0_g1~~gnl/Spiro4/23774_TR11759_c0_g1_i1.p1  ORF type:complete len:165 (+),score=16.70 gnl/Spiro4/23774_TR11759_c0_g1_i1:145-639(+)
MIMNATSLFFFPCVCTLASSPEIADFYKWVMLRAHAVHGVSLFCLVWFLDFLDHPDAFLLCWGHSLASIAYWLVYKVGFRRNFDILMSLIAYPGMMYVMLTRGTCMDYAWRQKVLVCCCVASLVFYAISRLVPQNRYAIIWNVCMHVFAHCGLAYGIECMGSNA